MHDVPCEDTGPIKVDWHRNWHRNYILDRMRELSLKMLEASTEGGQEEKT